VNNQLHDQLLAMSRTLGEPTNDYVILGEGNSSARMDEETFLVKASGFQLHNIGPEGFVRVRFDRALALLDEEGLSDQDVKDGLLAATVDNPEQRRPSVETTFHAVCLSAGQTAFVGHTHPTAVNAILCSREARAALARRLFPDEIVVCGAAPAFVPYVDPGLPLARAIRQAIREHVEEYGDLPKAIMLQNHGMIALGQSAGEVERITAMCVKAARILAGTYALGGPNFLTPANAERIYSRPDEHYRQRILEQMNQ
jgi:rhamnose utilization protein RhaD (predicted bifunctional aldolase and dehydrogenase)